MSISFEYLNVSFLLPFPDKISSWISEVIKREDYIPGEICIIFTDDSNILEINRQYLNHDYYTDVITFANCRKNIIAGDIFISIVTVQKNSKSYKVSFEKELYRVIIHGILHLLGYKDSTKEQKILIRKKEDIYLDILNNK